MEKPEESKPAEKSLVGVLFPGIVKNDEKAIQCLGGIRSISQVHSNPLKKRLGLSYQPENPFMKKFYADSVENPGFLLKVKVKKTKLGNEVKREIISTSVVGRVNRMHEFNAMCDFQYAPVNVDNEGEAHCLLDHILPTGMDDSSFLLKPAIYHVAPQNFTRMERPSNYAYTDKRYPNRKVSPSRETNESNDSDVCNIMRKQRSAPLAQVVFALVGEMPTEPHVLIMQRKTEKAVQHPEIEEEYNTVKKLFEERPIWSMNHIRYLTKINYTRIKVILPCLGFYFRNGPWRLLWVRFGYDPRKDPGARIYQTLDFRLRHYAGVHTLVMTRDQLDNYKKVDRVRQTHSRRMRGDPGAGAEDINESVVIYRPGMTPAQRQTFYQYCDIKLEEVERLIAAEPPPGYLCHPKRGWLGPNTDQVCRDLIFKHVKDAVFASTSDRGDLKLEQSSDMSDEGSDPGNASDDSTSDDLDESYTSNT